MYGKIIHFPNCQVAPTQLPKIGSKNNQVHILHNAKHTKITWYMIHRHIFDFVHKAHDAIWVLTLEISPSFCGHNIFLHVVKVSII